MKTGKKKKENSTQKWINITVIIILIFLVGFGLIYRYSKLENSEITTCKIVGFGLSQGGHGLTPKVVYYEYYVKGILYKNDSFFPDDNSIKVGNCYKLKYSVGNPNISEVLFENGAIDCGR